MEGGGDKRGRGDKGGGKIKGEGEDRGGGKGECRPQLVRFVVSCAD